MTRSLMIRCSKCLLCLLFLAACSEAKAPTEDAPPAERPTDTTAVAEAPTANEAPATNEAPAGEDAPNANVADDETAPASDETDDEVAQAGATDQSELNCDDADVSCPLYDFQVANAEPAVSNNDVAGVAKVLHQIEFFAPDPSWNEGENGWAQIARRGAVAAEAGKMREARKACRECHRLFPTEDTPFRNMYETQGYRTRALPALPDGAESTGLPDLVVEAG